MMTSFSLLKLVRFSFGCIVILIISSQATSPPLSPTSNVTPSQQINQVGGHNLPTIDNQIKNTKQVFEQAIFIENTTDIRIYNMFASLLMDQFKNYIYAQKVLDKGLLVANANININQTEQLSVLYYNMGMCQSYINDFNKSKFMFEESIKLNQPAISKMSYRRLGILFFDYFDDCANAITMFENVLKLDPTNVEACVDIATVLLRFDHSFTLKRSLQLFEKIVDILRHDVEFYNKFAINVMNKYHNWSIARAIFTKILSFGNLTRSQYAGTLHNLAIGDERIGNYTSAAALFEKIIALCPLRFDIYIRLADILSDILKQHKKAAKVYIKAMQIQMQTRRSINQQLWQKLMNLVTRRRVSYDQVAELVEGTNEFQIMSTFGSELIQSGFRNDLVLSLFEKCVSIESDWWNVWYYLGIAQADAGQCSNAINSLNNSIQLYPYWESFSVLGVLYLDVFGNRDKSQKMFERAIQLAPDNLPSQAMTQLELCHFKLGQILSATGNNTTEKQQAMYHFERIILIDPNAVLARIEYAAMLLKYCYDIDAAIAIIVQGLKLESNNDVLLGMLGILGILQTQSETQATIGDHDHDYEQTTQLQLHLFQKAIYQFNTHFTLTHLHYARYLFNNQLLQSDQMVNMTIAQEIETILYKVINYNQSDNTDTHTHVSIAKCIMDQAYQQLALLKMTTMNREMNESVKHETMMQIYDRGLNELPNSGLLRLGKAYLLQNDYFKQYKQSIKMYKLAIKLCRIDDIPICKVNAMFNLASLLMDQHSDRNSDPDSNQINFSKMLVTRACKRFIRELSGGYFSLINHDWVGNFESTIKKFRNSVGDDELQSLILEVLGLYYESLNRFKLASMQYIMSIYYNEQNNKTNNSLIMVSHWKLARIFSRDLNSSNAQSMKHFVSAIDESYRSRWNNFQLSQLYYDFGYFLQTKMNDVWNATKYYAKSVQLNSYNIKANSQLDQIMEQNEDIFSQFERCACCSRIMIEQFQPMWTNNCTHQFHVSCINKWYQTKQEKTCPLCRKPQP